MNLEVWLNKKIKKNRQKLNKIFIGMMWFIVFLLLSAIYLIATEFFDKTRGFLINAYVGIMLVYIALFALLIFIPLVKYKKEILLNDTERKEQWASLDQSFKRFYRLMSLFGICFGAFITLFPIINFIVNKDFYGIWLIPIGILVLVNGLKERKRLKD